MGRAINNALWQHGGTKRLSLLHSITHLLNKIGPSSISMNSLIHLERLQKILNIFVENFGEKSKWGKHESTSKRSSGATAKKELSIGTRYIPLLQASVECSSILSSVLDQCKLAKSKGYLRQTTTLDLTVESEEESEDETNFGNGSDNDSDNDSDNMYTIPNTSETKTSTLSKRKKKKKKVRNTSLLKMKSREDKQIQNLVIPSIIEQKRIDLLESIVPAFNALRNIASGKLPMNLLSNVFKQDMKDRMTVVISSDNHHVNPGHANKKNTNESKNQSNIDTKKGEDGEQNSEEHLQPPSWLMKTDNYMKIASVRKDIDETAPKLTVKTTSAATSTSTTTKSTTVNDEQIMLIPDTESSLQFKLSSGNRFFTPDLVPIQRSTSERDTNVFVMGRSKELKWRIRAKRRGGASSKAVNRMSRNHMRVTTHRFDTNSDDGDEVDDG